MSKTKANKAAKLKAGLTKAGDASTLGAAIGNTAVTAMLVDIVARLGTHVMRKGVEGALLPSSSDENEGPSTKAPKQQKDAPEKPAKEKPTIAHKLVVGALTKIGTKSLPGAVAVGGVIVAREVYLRKKAQRLIQESEEA